MHNSLQTAGIVTEVTCLMTAALLRSALSFLQIRHVMHVHMIPVLAVLTCYQVIGRLFLTAFLAAVVQSRSYRRAITARGLLNRAVGHFLERFHLLWYRHLTCGRTDHDHMESKFATLSYILNPPRPDIWY